MHGDVINPEEKILTPATTWAGGGAGGREPE